MAKARPVAVDADAPFRDAARATLRVRGPELLEFRAGTLDGADTTQLHSMRVASRRLRASLEVYADCFPRRRHARLLRLVKETADALSEARDLDVQIEHLTAYRDRVPHAHRAGVDSLIATLRGRRDAANGHIVPALARLDDEDFGGQVAALLDADP
jgi:CHAD domain-containing protein